MPSSSYYRRQANLLLLLALVTSDQDYATQLEARARLYLTVADHPDNCPDLPGLLDDFNDRQLRSE
jgi:hypothetical protein